MPIKVLIIDDEMDYRIIAKDILSSAGMEVALAEDGSAGLEALKSFHPDVVLVDWMMPKTDGQGFCRALRNDPRFKNLPVLMLTVKRGPEEEMEALHFGVDDFLVKPFKPAELLSRVHAVLRRAADGKTKGQK